MADGPSPPSKPESDDPDGYADTGSDRDADTSPDVDPDAALDADAAPDTAAVDPVRAVLEAAGFPEFPSAPLLDLTWEALYSALVFLPVPILELLKVGRELRGQPHEPATYEGFWTLSKLIKARAKLRCELLIATDTEARLTLDEPAPWEPPPTSCDDDGGPVPFEWTDRELARMGVVAVLAYDLRGGGLTPKRFLCCALALGLVTVVDPRFSVLCCLLKGDQLRAAAEGLEAIGARLRMLLLELRFADEPNPDLLARLQDAFERLDAVPSGSPGGPLVLRDGPGGPEAMLGGRTCSLSERHLMCLRTLPPADRPVLGCRALAVHWGFGERQHRLASSTYSQIWKKLEKHVGTPCLKLAPRGGKFALDVELLDEAAPR